MNDLSPEDEAMINDLREEAKRVFPEDRWTMELIYWANGSVHAEVFHTCNTVDGMPIRDYLVPDGVGGYARHQRRVDLERRHLIPGDDHPMEYGNLCADVPVEAPTDG